MPILVMNDTPIETDIGACLLDVARQEGIHIGLMNDMSEFFQMCECRVLRGHEHLTPPDEMEHVWFTTRQLQEGHRLASRAIVTGSGPVEVLTRAEELRRQAMAVLFRTPDVTIGESLGRILNNLIHINAEHLRCFPQNLFFSLNNAIGPRQRQGNVGTMLTGVLRMTGRMIRGDVPTIQTDEGRSLLAKDVSPPSAPAPKPVAPAPAPQAEAPPASAAPKPVEAAAAPVPQAEAPPASAAPKPVEAAPAPVPQAEAPPASAAPKPVEATPAPAPKAEAPPASAAPKPVEAAAAPAPKAETAPTSPPPRTPAPKPTPEAPQRPQTRPLKRPPRKK